MKRIGVGCKGLAGLLGLSVGVFASASAFAWGDEGHEVVALVAVNYLDAAVKTKIDGMLKGDVNKLTPHDIASEATWADRYRDSDRNTTRIHYNQTHNWHFVNTELQAPDIDAACNNHPAVPQGKRASLGAADDCVVDKIDEFAAELKSPATSRAEKLNALRFLLHFVGDLHQPLHSSDDNHDQGGNLKFVSAPGIPKGKLHHYWDTEFVQRIGSDPAMVARDLILKITPAQVSQWSAGTPTDWAQESFTLAKTQAYGALPAPYAPNQYKLPKSYVDDAVPMVGEQLSKGGVRLAAILNDALK